MIIEDDARLALIYKKSLERRGHHVAIMAEGTKDALRKFEAALSNGGSPDFIVADRRLPDGDGLEVCKQLIQVAPGTTIVLATADPVDENLARKAGVSMQLTKPFSMHDLIAAVENGRGDKP